MHVTSVVVVISFCSLTNAHTFLLFPYRFDRMSLGLPSHFRLVEWCVRVEQRGEILHNFEEIPPHHQQKCSKSACTWREIYVALASFWKALMMSHVISISPCFLNLPIESIYRILDHLDPADILLSVRDVRSRLNAITDTYHPYKVNAVITVNNHLLRVKVYRYLSRNNPIRVRTISDTHKTVSTAQADQCPTYRVPGWVNKNKPGEIHRLSNLQPSHVVLNADNHERGCVVQRDQWRWCTVSRYCIKSEPGESAVHCVLYGFGTDFPGRHSTHWILRAIQWVLPVRRIWLLLWKTLNIPSTKIGDAGAAHIGDALRVNQVRKWSMMCCGNMMLIFVKDTYNSESLEQHDWWRRCEASCCSIESEHDECAIQSAE